MPFFIKNVGWFIVIFVILFASVLGYVVPFIQNDQRKNNYKACSEGYVYMRGESDMHVCIQGYYVVPK